MANPRDTKAQTPVVPLALNNDLFEFLEKQFDKDFPEYIELVQTYGPSGRQRGNTLDTVFYKPNEARPKKEALVEMSNHFLKLAQKDCDAIRKPHKYVVMVWNTLKSPKPIGGFPLLLEPSSGLAAFGEEDGEDERKDEFGSDKLLRRVDRVFSDDRWRVEQYAQAVGGVIKMQAEIIEQLKTQNDNLMTKWLEGVKVIETAASEIHKRNLETEFQKFKFKMLEGGADVVKQYLPIAINKIKGKDVVPTNDTEEGLALQMFFKGLSEAQREALIGVWNEGGCIKPGVFTKDQLQIIDGVMYNKCGVEALEGLAEGEAKLTPDQLGQIQSICSMSQLAPLMVIMSKRNSPAETPKEEPKN